MADDISRGMSVEEVDAMADEILGDIFENIELEDAHADLKIKHEEPQVEQSEANEDAAGSPI